MLSKDDLVRLNTTGFNKFARLLGVEFLEIEPGRCVAAIDVHEDLFHPGGIVHGGVAFSLADSSMALSIIAGLEPGENCSTIESKISYMKPVVKGRIVSEATVIRKGRRVVFVEARVTNNDELIATVSASFAIVRSR